MRNVGNVYTFMFTSSFVMIPITDYTTSLNSYNLYQLISQVSYFNDVMLFLLFSTLFNSSAEIVKKILWRKKQYCKNYLLETVWFSTSTHFPKSFRVLHFTWNICKEFSAEGYQGKNDLRLLHLHQGGNESPESPAYVPNSFITCQCKVLHLHCLR